MKISLIAGALLLMAGAAQAGEANTEPFPDTIAGAPVANQVLGDTGSETAPQFGRATTLLTQGAVLPVTGSEGAVQAANSLPVGAEEGTVTYAQAQLVQRWMLTHQGSTGRLVTADASHTVSIDRLAN